MTEEPTNSTPSTPPEGGSTGGTENWEKRFKGLQLTFDRLQTKYNKLEEEHQNTLAELESLRQEKRTFEGDKKKLAEQVSSLEGEKTQLQSQVTSHQFQVERTRIVMGEFADLASFEAKGLLPAAENADDLRAKLNTYRETIKGMVDLNVQNRFQGQAPSGAGPANTQNNTAHTRESLYRKLASLAGSRDPKDRREYDTLMQEWLELNK